ncbi:hypothetical protein [Bacillus marasmi]|uniref:hypothetical protein n=1 Tax=Bacillus marasmi TaxID=1926279 RepID=UPI0011CA4921|nr:hypothetical protein [Bacillus marasmi]
MEFKEYLRRKHLLNKKEMKLMEISVEQYFNRLENMRRAGIYNEEKQIDDVLERKIQERYKDWETYVRTIKYYLSSKKY